MTGVAWSASEDRVLLGLVAQGYAGTAIADQLGRTRGAVIGRLHRMGEAGDPRVEKALAGYEKSTGKPRWAEVRTDTVPRPRPRREILGRDVPAAKVPEHQRSTLPSDPCFRCGARGWCAHRRPDPTPINTGVHP